MSELTDYVWIRDECPFQESDEDCPCFCLIGYAGENAREGLTQYMKMDRVEELKGRFNQVIEASVDTVHKLTDQLEAAQKLNDEALEAIKEQAKELDEFAYTPEGNGVLDVN